MDDVVDAVDEIGSADDVFAYLSYLTGSDTYALILLCGAAVLVVLLVTACCCCICRHRKKKKATATIRSAANAPSVDDRQRLEAASGYEVRRRQTVIFSSRHMAAQHDLKETFQLKWKILMEWLANHFP